ncbi:MAG: AAA family ATPase [Acidimicrobiia bacterium]|nr:AAA family ATPase [Acidimicrobiia bacterium]
MPPPTLQVQMLGGFSLQLGDEPVGSIPSRAASLLAYLILNRDREHTRDLLAGRFWSDTTDDKARRRLSQALWHIGKATRETHVDLVHATSQKISFSSAIEVVLDVETFEQRLGEFQRQAQANRRAVRVSDLSAIVEIYRGSLLAGHYDDWIRDEREKLRNRYREALSQLVSLTSAESDYETALRYAQTLVAEEPLDEDAQRELLRLYAITGRPASAERHYKRLVKELDEQVQAKPSAETTALMNRILDEAATPPLGAVDDSERSRHPFIGRRAERPALLNRVIELTQGKGGIVLLEGEPGVGKTRLVEELAEGAEWRGVQVLLANHTEVSALTPYDGLRQALAPVTSGLRGEVLQKAVDDLWLRQASGVLPGLVKLASEDKRQLLRPEEEPWRTTEALAQIILSLGQPKPTLVILEDVQFCDEDTMAVLTQLGDRLIDTQVLVCLTYQLQEARRADAVWDGLSALEASPGSSRVVVPPLQDDEVHELITAELGPGRLSRTVADQLVKATGGNPYVVLELLRSPVEMLDDGVFELDAGETSASTFDEQLAPRMTEIVMRRLDVAPAAVRLVLEGLAALGVPSPSSVVAQAADLDLPTCIDALQRAVDLGFLVDTGRGCDFVQAQTRRIVYDALPVERRGGLHGRIVDALTLSDLRANIPQIAKHAWLAGQWQRAYQYHSLAADSALAVNAFQTAAEHFTKADHAAQAAGLDDEDRIADLLEFEEVLDILGRRDDQSDLLSRLLALADQDLATRLLITRRRALLLLNTGAAAEAAEMASAAAREARAAGQSAGELLVIIGTARARMGRLEAALEPLQDAIDDLRAAGLAVVDAQLMLGRVHAELKNLDAAHRYLEEAYNEAKQANEVRSQVEALGHLAPLWADQEEDGRAERAFLEALSLARRIGFRFGEGANLVNLAAFYVFHGRAGQAVDPYVEAGQVFASLGDARGVAFVKANNSWLLHWVFGDDETAKRQAEEAAAELRRLGDARTEALCLNTAAGVERRAGQRRRARRRLVHALDRARAGHDRHVEARTHLNLALVELDMGHHTEALEHLDAANELRTAHDLANLSAILAAVEARAQIQSGQRIAALELVERAIRANRPSSDRAHLASWWSAEVLRDAGDEQGAAQQVALAHKLLARSLEGVDAELVEQAWSAVPEHRAILEAREHYFVDEVHWQVPAVGVPTGRPLVDGDLVEVRWTRSHPDDWDSGTPAERRRRRLLRLIVEAAEQGGAARQSDLAAILEVSERTIKRDLALLRQEGDDPFTRRG